MNLKPHGVTDPELEVKHVGAACGLAPHLREAVNDCYTGGLLLSSWALLKPAQKAYWIQLCSEFLKTLNPRAIDHLQPAEPAHVAPVRHPDLAAHVFEMGCRMNRIVATGLRPTHGPVIGQIDPPEGEAS